MNNFKKFGTVFIAECESEYKKGDIISLETKYGKEVECEVYNLVSQANNKFYYSIIRTDSESYATKKANKYKSIVKNRLASSQKWYDKTQEDKDFLSLAEPIKVGHHSEHRHRALIERNWTRMGKSVQLRDEADKMEQKAKYWEKKEGEINLSMPESLEYYTHKLEEAKAHHKGLKEGTIQKEHSYSVVYANNKVKDLVSKLEMANKLWGQI